jgi:hypothetical protein
MMIRTLPICQPPHSRLLKVKDFLFAAAFQYVSFDTVCSEDVVWRMLFPSILLVQLAEMKVKGVSLAGLKVDKGRWGITCR